MVDKRTPIPVTLERGEREVRRDERVKIEGGEAGGIGFLLLTNRRLIFNGELLDERGEQCGSTAWEWFLGDIIDVSYPWLGKKLLVIFQKVILKVGHPREASGKIPATIFPNPVVYHFTNINQPKKWKSDIEELKKALS